MAHFIGYVKGTRGEASRLGSTKDGIQSRVQGWKSGVKVLGRNTGTGDWFEVIATGGSDVSAPEQPVAIVGLLDNGELFVQTTMRNPILCALENLLECMGACEIAPGALERAVERENVDEAVARARAVIRRNKSPNSVGKVEAKA